VKLKEFVDFVKSLKSLTCKEKGHSQLCECPDNPWNKKLEQDSQEYIPPVVTARDFQEPGLSADAFLETVTNEQDKKKLKAFFDKQR